MRNYTALACVVAGALGLASAPASAQDNNISARPEICEPRECKTACDCAPGLGCFDGACIAGFAPVYCCEGDFCPVGQQCQHDDGPMDRCEGEICRTRLWRCDSSDECPADRVCACTASCPECDDCGPSVCLPRNNPTPYRCGEGGECANPGDVCMCVPSCPTCKDCAIAVCVPKRCDDPKCEKRLKAITSKTRRLVARASRCEVDRECVRVDTSTECAGTCGAWINRRYVDRFERILDKLDRRICDGYREDGCPYLTPACLLESGRCVDQRCTGVPRPFPIDPKPIEFLTPDRLLELEAVR